LTLVTAPDGRGWWVEKGKWKEAKQAQYHDAPLCRHVGEARLRVGSETIRLRIAPTGFAGEEFDALLEEFRNGAWKLILDPLSPTRATDQRGDGGIDPAFLDAVAEFIRYAGRGLDQPHRELREIRESQRLERVRPNVGTFRELAVRGFARLVVGRGHAPTFDTLENRQLLAMCKRLRRTLLGLLEAAEGAATDLKGRIREEVKRADKLQRMVGYGQVDDRLLLRLIEEIQSDLRNHPEAIRSLLGPEERDRTHSVRVQVTQEVSVNRKYQEVGFWCDVIAVNGREKRGAKRYLLTFDKDHTLLRAIDSRMR
jgi:hypothetical protein